MRTTHLLVQAILATAVAANLKHLLVHRQSDSCTGGLSDQICYDPSSSLADCRDAICADPCYIDVPGIQECCNTASTSEFSDCLQAQIDGSGGSLSSSFSPVYSPSRTYSFGSSSSLPRYLTETASPTQPASITAAPTAGAGSGSGSASDPCSIVIGAVDTCSSAISNFDNLPALSQGSCYCSAAGPDAFDSALDGCIRTGTISIPNASDFASIAPTFCFEVGAAPSPTGAAAGAGGSQVPTTRPVATAQPSSFTPAGIETSPRVVVSTVVIGNTQGVRTTSAPRTTNPVAGGLQTSTGGAPMGITPTDWLSALTAIVLAALGV